MENDWAAGALVTKFFNKIVTASHLEQSSILERGALIAPKNKNQTKHETKNYYSYDRSGIGPGQSRLSPSEGTGRARTET
jgi:hypothetical protein